MKRIIFLTLAVFTSYSAIAKNESMLLNTVEANLEKVEKHPKSTGTIAQLAKKTNGHSLMMLRSFKKGEVGSPHKPGNKAVRVGIVIQGTLYYGVGETVDPTKEKTYQPGDVILMASNDTYWMAARDNDTSIIFTFIPPEQLNPALLKQMQ